MGCLIAFVIVAIIIYACSSVEAFIVCSIILIGIVVFAVYVTNKNSQKNKEITDSLEKKYNSKINMGILNICQEVVGIGLTKGEYRGWVANNRFYLGKLDNIDNIYLDISLDDVLGYEKLCEIENKGISLGKAVVGGVLFGGAGAVLGGLMGKSNKKEEVVLLINYRNEEVFIILYPISLSALQQIMPNKQAKPSRQTNIQGLSSNQTVASQSNNYDELEKLAELRDKGIITSDEFDIKKKQILGL